MTKPPDRKWPVGLYAPGTYWCRCAKCGQSHLADKRAQHCADCTIQNLVAAIAAARAEGREQGLREARGIAHSLAVQNHELGFDDMKCGALEVVEHLDDLIPARPANGGDT